jgi:hypothetical protein
MIHTLGGWVMAAKGIWIAVASSFVTLGVGALVMHGIDEMHEESVEEQYESSIRAKYSSGSVSSATTSSKGLPTQQEVDNRLEKDLKAYIEANKTGVVTAGSLEDNRDRFEDEYLDRYEAEVEPTLSEKDEEIFEDMVEIALMKLNFDQAILDAR